ncbi:MAG: FAD-dependent oxidoreductase [Kiritimatiellae bacterium]|nr:FAD-dependent oxidoreductase [Kiritimatiellia bacterium]
MIGNLIATSVIVLYAQCFDAGGWKLDGQFMDVIGTPYLLAHGLGNRVEDATTTADVVEAGEYRVWVYARNWADGAPGRFAVSVGGKRLDKVFGAGSSDWSWEDGGMVSLSAGTVAVSLNDLMGFDGRCGGIALVKDGEKPTEPLDMRQEPVMENFTAEFVIVGGGLPGTCAAVAAARRGLKTILLQDRPVVGGNASQEVRVWCAGEARYPLVRELRGTFMNMEGATSLSDARRMDILRHEPNLDLRTSYRVFAAEKSADGSIAAVKALDLKRNRVVRFSAPLFADATGDGWLGFYAGAESRMGREAKDEFDESFAPERADGDTLGASLMWTSADGNAPIPFSAPWAEPHAQGIVKVNGEWNWEYGIHRDMIAEGEAIRDRLLLAIYGSFSLAKKNPENANRVLNFVPFILGKRESRRLMGDYVYSERDVSEKRQFVDAIAAGSWSIDLHYDTFKSGVDYLTTCNQPHYGRYWIPYRSIYSRNVQNLFVIGRCFSCTHVGLGGPRVINTLSQLGVAAGEAAALCRQYGIMPRGVYADGHVRELQDRLGGDFPGRPDPMTVGWSIVDDETEGVSFGVGWVKTHCALGEQYGDYAHFTGGSVWGPDPKKVPVCGEVVYPLPVTVKGRYALMGRIPFVRTTPTGSITAFVIESGNRSVEFTFNQAYEPGVWHEFGMFELEPGARLKIVPGKSQGIVVADAFAIVGKDL